MNILGSQQENSKYNDTDYTGCFMTLGHNCRRCFHRSLWWKKFT